MIAAGKDEIKKWFMEGAAKGHKYMLVVYDRTEYPQNSDSAYYADSADSARDKVRVFSNDPMSKVMEIYDLMSDMETQLAEKQVWNLPLAPEGSCQPDNLPTDGLLSSGETRLAFMETKNTEYMEKYFDDGDCAATVPVHVFADNTRKSVYTVSVYLLEQSEPLTRTVAVVYRFSQNGEAKAYDILLMETPDREENKYDILYPLDQYHKVSVDEPYIRFSLYYAIGKEPFGSAYRRWFHSATKVYMENNDCYGMDSSTSSFTVDDAAHADYKRGIELLKSGQEGEMRLFMNAAANGHADAAYAIGKKFYLSEGLFTDKNDKRPNRIKEEAMDWFKKAALMGHPTAALMVAHGYDGGDGLPLNKNKALYWFEHAAASAESLPEGEEPFQKISKMYWRGEGTEKNYERSTYWAKRAASNKKLCLVRAKQIRDGDWEAEGVFEYMCLKTALNSGEEWAAPVIDKKFDEETRNRMENLLSQQ